MYSNLKKYAALAILAVGLTSTASTASASGSAGWGRHNLMVLVYSKVASMRVHYADNRGYWYSRCINLDRRAGWKSPGIRVFNGSPVYVQTFYGYDCISGYIGTSEGSTVPGEDGLTNFWYTKAAQ